MPPIQQYHFRARSYEVARVVAARRYHRIALQPWVPVGIQVHRTPAHPSQVFLHAAVLSEIALGHAHEDREPDRIEAVITLVDHAPGETVARLEILPKPLGWRLAAAVQWRAAALIPRLEGRIAHVDRHGRRAILAWWAQNLPRWVAQLEAAAPVAVPRGQLPEVTDPIDRRILELVTKDPDLTDDEIGARLNLSRQAINPRRRALEKMGYRTR